MRTEFLKIAEATNNELFDAEYKGGEWMTEAVETAETLENWENSAKSWASRTPMMTGELAGFPFRAWKTVQTAKGKARQAMSIIDIGEFRVALPGTDLSIFGKVTARENFSVL